MATRVLAVCSRYLITVDRGMSFTAMLAAGRYYYLNPDITTEHFPIVGSGTTEMELFLLRFNRAVDTDEVVTELDRRGYRPADLVELLALGAHPKTRGLRQRLPIVVLGTTWLTPSGRRLYPFLYKGCGGRSLGLVQYADRWCNYYFAAVRK